MFAERARTAAMRLPDVMFRSRWRPAMLRGEAMIAVPAGYAESERPTNTDGEREHGRIWETLGMADAIGPLDTCDDRRRGTAGRV